MRIVVCAHTDAHIFWVRMKANMIVGYDFERLEVAGGCKVPETARASAFGLPQALLEGGFGVL